MERLIKAQRDFFMSGKTLSYKFRSKALDDLRLGIIRLEKEICAALKQDLNKPEAEAYMTEVGMVLEELSFTKKHLARWMKPQRRPAPLSQFPSKCFILSEPFGVSLIMSPWNYPFQLCIVPLIGAIAAGNCATIKPSAYAPATSKVIKKLIDETFSPEYITVIEGGRAQNTALLEQRFDYIFFTGSVEVGKLVMERAAKNLTPVSLELGGKSPVIVDSTADIELAAKRLIFGKCLNAGQTCVAPDYILVQKSIKAVLVDRMIAAIKEFFPNGYGDLVTIVNDKHFSRIMKLAEGEKVLFGGANDPSTRFIEPMILDEITFDSPVMQEEIFGPLLPLIEYDSLSEAIELIQSRPKPLALYLFTTDKAVEKEVLQKVSFGGGCVNDTLMHITSAHLPFGGVGDSGMGSYHGKQSFDTFSHKKSILKKANWLDIKVRYRPYTDKTLKIVKSLLK